jgi:hypothetical protein
VHVSDAQLPDFTKDTAAAAESAPLMGADGTLAGSTAASAAAASKPVGIFSDVSSCGLVQ